MLLRDLLSDPELGLVLLTGQQHLDRPVRGLYITDLLDPRRYLDGGELVLSGLVWHNGPADSERFVAALADAGVAGLAAGTARLGNAPADLVEACRRYDVPAFQVPVAVSFNTLAERVQRRGVTSRGELVTAVATGAEQERVLAMAARELGADCWVLSPAGWLSGVPELAEDQRAELVRRFLAAERLPATVRLDTGSFVLWPVESDVQPPAARWFVAVRGDQRQWSEEQAAVAADLGTAAALLRSRLDQARKITARSVEATLRRLLDGSASPPEVAARLETAGLPAQRRLRVAAVAAGDSEVASTLLREIAAATGMDSVTVPLWGGASALFLADAQRLSGLEDRLRRAAAEVGGGLGGLELTIGLSDISGCAGLRGALEEASYARRLAARRPDGVATGAELASHQVLLAAVPDELRGSYRERVLAPLVEYDRQHDTELVSTLRTFLECSGAWSRCAKRLHVHVNTLRYRIHRIEQITGRDLGEFASRVDFYLAFELRPTVGR